MKKVHVMMICLLASLLVFACSVPKPADEDAIATQVAADIFATQTAGAPTDTPVPAPTDAPVPAPTDTPVPAPTTSLALFADDFSDPDSGWSTGSTDGGEIRYEDGELLIRDYTTPSAPTISWPGQSFTDMIMEVESRWVGGTDDNWHGHYCRHVDDDNYYVVAFSADGYYTGFAEVGGERNDWVGPTRSDAIRQGIGTTNVARLECVGSRIRFWVNDTLLIDVTDTNLTAGDVALDAESQDGEYTEIAYDNLIVLAP